MRGRPNEPRLRSVRNPVRIGRPGSAAANPDIAVEAIPLQQRMARREGGCEMQVIEAALLASHDVHGWDEWVWPLLGLLIVTIGVIWCGWLVSRPAGALGSRTARDRAREILAERFARGEVTAEEYRERLSELEARASQGTR
jgi:putative membrane protein